MSTIITTILMRGTLTRHTARRVGGGWEITWLPGRILTRNRAITEMTIAEVVTSYDLADNTPTRYGITSTTGRPNSTSAGQTRSADKAGTFTPAARRLLFLGAGDRAWA